MSDPHQDGVNSLLERQAERKKELDYAWAAGVLEGEGCFSIFKRKERRNTRSVAIHCVMGDEDIVRRLHSLFGCGHVSIIPPRSENWKTMWAWQVQNKVGVLEVILRVLPYLGIRRTAKAKELMNHIETRGYNG